jgi:hypothetical protein
MHVGFGNLSAFAERWEEPILQGQQVYIAAALTAKRQGLARNSQTYPA